MAISFVAMAIHDVRWSLRVSVCVCACVCLRQVVWVRCRGLETAVRIFNSITQWCKLQYSNAIGGTDDRKTIGCLRAKRRKQIRWHRLITSLRSLKRTAAECLLYSFQCGQQWTILNGNSYAFGPRVVLIESFHHINNDRTINLRR